MYVQLYMHIEIYTYIYLYTYIGVYRKKRMTDQESEISSSPSLDSLEVYICIFMYVYM
jgi:hypothetical protein